MNYQCLNLFFFPLLISTAKICPQLEAPSVEIWDSYAELQRSGTRYGNCIFDGPASSSPEIWIKWKERINEGPNGNYKDTYDMKFTLTKAMSDLVVNITFSMAPSSIEGTFFLFSFFKLLNYIFLSAMSFRRTSKD